MLAQNQANSELQRELCVILRKKFSIKLAIDIQQSLVIRTLAPNKIGVRFKRDLHLAHEQKEQLREILCLVYGQNVAIVSLPKLQAVTTTAKSTKKTPPLATNKVTSTTPIALEPITNWQKARKHLVEVYGEDLVRVSFEKLSINESANQITFTGSDTFTEIVEGKFGANLSWLAREYDISFVFKGENKVLKELVVSEINKW